MPRGDGTGPWWGGGRRAGRGRGMGRGMGRRQGMGRGMGVGPGLGHGIGASLTEIPTVAVPKVDLKKCVGCGECAKACPFGAIQIKDGKAVVNAALCQGCRACASACPTGAIT